MASLTPLGGKVTLNSINTKQLLALDPSTVAIQVTNNSTSGQTVGFSSSFSGDDYTTVAAGATSIITASATTYVHAARSGASITYWPMTATRSQSSSRISNINGLSNWFAGRSYIQMGGIDVVVGPGDSYSEGLNVFTWGNHWSNRLSIKLSAKLDSDCGYAPYGETYMPSCAGTNAWQALTGLSGHGLANYMYPYSYVDSGWTTNTGYDNTSIGMHIVYNATGNNRCWGNFGTGIETIEWVGRVHPAVGTEGTSLIDVSQAATGPITVGSGTSNSSVLNLLTSTNTVTIARGSGTANYGVSFAQIRGLDTTKTTCAQIAVGTNGTNTTFDGWLCYAGNATKSNYSRGIRVHRATHSGATVGNFVSPAGNTPYNLVANVDRWGQTTDANCATSGGATRAKLYILEFSLNDLSKAYPPQPTTYQYTTLANFRAYLITLITRIQALPSAPSILYMINPLYQPDTNYTAANSAAYKAQYAAYVEIIYELSTIYNFAILDMWNYTGNDFWTGYATTRGWVSSDNSHMVDNYHDLVAQLMADALAS